MAGPIRKLFLIKSYREAFYQLSEAEQDAFWKKILAAEEAAGAREVITCDSWWCDEGVLAWGVIDYPDLQAMQRMYRESHTPHALLRYVNSETFLGAGGETWNETVDLPDAIYQLFMIRGVSTEPMESLPQEERDQLWRSMVESMETNGAVGMFWSNISWSHEEYAGFGVIAWPNVEALQAHSARLDELGWHRYMHARTILGTKFQAG